jgi:hypothetical protein
MPMLNFSLNLYFLGMKFMTVVVLLLTLSSREGNIGGMDKFLESIDYTKLIGKLNPLTVCPKDLLVLVSPAVLSI